MPRLLTRIYITVLLFLFSMNGFSQSGSFDVRFHVSNIDAGAMKLYVDIEIRADAPGTEFNLSDQNYRFSFNRDALANPQLAGELEISDIVQQTSPATTSIYSTHTLIGSLDTIVSYNLELAGGDGYYLNANDYASVGTVSFDILDINVPLCLEFHDYSLADFPNTFISEKFNGVLISTAEGSYLDYCQDLSDAFTNDLPIAVADSGTTPEEQAITVCVAANDSDPENLLDALSVSIITPPLANEGTASVDASGCIVFTPTADFAGVVTPIEYQICDTGIFVPSYQGDSNGAGVPSPDPGDPDIQTMPPACTTALLNITVDPVNDMPVALDDSDSTTEDIALNGTTTLSNDSDVDGDNLTVTTTPVTPPTNGALVLNTDGTYTYTPNADFFGTDSFEYEVCDDGSPVLCTTAIVNITINSENDAPVATNDIGFATEDIALNGITTLGNDSDVDGDNLTVTTTPVTPPTNGILVLNTDGTYTYTPNANFNGSDSFEYEVCDDGSPVLCSTATVSLVITGANDAPVALDDSGSTAEDVALNGTATLTNDSDVDGDNLTVTTTPVTPPTNGALTLNTDGTYTYTPSANFFGTDSFEYEVCDDGSPVLCTTAIVNITISSENDAPIATNDIGFATEDIALNGAATLANDSDVDGDNLTVTTTPVTPPANGALVLNADGTYTYTPNADFNGSDSFEYEVCDDGSPVLCSTAMVNLVVTGTNDAPVAIDDTAPVTEDMVLNGTTTLANDSDVDGDNLTVTTTPVTAPTNGTLLLNTDGTYTYTPNADFNGSDSFEYEVCDDGSPVLCSTGIVNITVDPANDMPVATDDTDSTTEDIALNGTTTLSNDSDVDGDNLMVTTTPVTPPANGTLVLNTDGTYTYTPNADFNGSDSFEYEVCDDGSPVLCTTAVVNITIDPANDTPVAVADANSTTEDTSLNGATVLTNDSDIDGDNIAVNTTPIVPPTNGTLVLSASGTYIYIPNANFNGTDSFEYEVCDDGNPALCATAVVTISVSPVNDTPTANGDINSTLENVTLNGTSVLLNDSDIDGDNLTVTTTPVATTSNGSLTLNSDGTYVYIPNSAYNGTDSFEYEVCDDGSPVLCTTAIVNLSVGAVNDPPITNVDDFTTDEDLVLSSGNVLDNDSDLDGDNLMVTTTPVVAPVNGILSLNTDGTFTYTPNPDFNGSDSFDYEVCDDGVPVLCSVATVNITIDPVNDAPIAMDDMANTAEETLLMTGVSSNDTDIDGGSPTFILLTGTNNGTLTFNADGTYTYQPNVDFNGTDSFTYQMDDGNGGTDQATVTIDVTPVNDAPIAMDDSETTAEETLLSGDASPNDTDVDGGAPTFILLTGTNNGTLTFNADGTYTYQPNVDFNGTDSFTYQMDDGNGGTDQATVTIDVTPVNDAPVAMDDSETTPEEMMLSADVSPNDTDVDGGMPTFSLVSGTANGTLMFNADGTYTYLPDTDFDGTDSFTYEINDGNGGTDQGTVTIDVSPINDAPVAMDDTASVQEDVMLSDDVSPNDTDVDGGAPTFTLVSGTTNGTLTFNADGTYTYLPNADFNGADSFTYEMNDGNGGTDQATVMITVDPVNDAPVANDDAETTAEEVLLSADVSPNDTDIDGGVPTFILFIGTSNGTLTFNANGTYTYLPNPDFNGTDSFTYQMMDGNGGVDQAVVTIEVTPINDVPVAVNDLATVAQNGSVVVDVTANDTDVEDAPLDPCNVTIATQPSFGTISFGAAPGCELTYTPNPGYVGPDSFEYQVCDSGGACVNGIVDVDVEQSCVDIQLAVFLEGALSDLLNGYLSGMRTDLNTARDLLPGQALGTPTGQPYNVAPWNHTGTEGAGWTDADYQAVAMDNGGRQVVDWILVSFRTGIAASTTIEKAAALLLEDGTVVFTDACVLTVADPGPVYIVVEHRNHMGVMSHVPVDVVGGQLMYDFRTGLSYPDPLPGFSQKEISPGMFAMHAGDGDQGFDITSYDINGQDKIVWTVENGIFAQYLLSDYNMDGDVNGGDKILWENNNGLSSTVPK